MVLELTGFRFNGKVNIRTCLVRCDCEKEYEVDLNSVVTGSTKSCGCVGRKRNFGNSAERDMYGSYKDNAKARGYEFNLDYDYFRELISNECHYCSSRPNRKIHAHGEDSIVNGVDRINNDIGYVIDNVVTCCTICNLAKRDMKYYDFIEWVKIIGRKWLCA